MLRGADRAREGEVGWGRRDGPREAVASVGAPYCREISRCDHRQTLRAAGMCYASLLQVPLSHHTPDTC